MGYKHSDKITLNDETKTIEEWSKYLNINAKTLLSRLNNLHWTIEKTLTTPLRTKLHKAIQSKLPSIRKLRIFQFVKLKCHQCQQISEVSPKKLYFQRKAKCKYCKTKLTKKNQI